MMHLLWWYSLYVLRLQCRDTLRGLQGEGNRVSRGGSAFAGWLAVATFADDNGIRTEVLFQWVEVFAALLVNGIE